MVTEPSPSTPAVSGGVPVASEASPGFSGASGRPKEPQLQPQQQLQQQQLSPHRQMQPQLQQHKHRKTPQNTSINTISAMKRHHYAQEMNNSAASCIEIGLYGRAAASLKRALALSRLPTTTTSSSSGDSAEICSGGCYSCCTCQECTLDGCIVHSSAVSAASRHHQQHQQQQQQAGGAPAAQQPPLSGSYIHRTPIRVKSQGHPMGSALSLAITFNLALTHHLIALQHHQQHPVRSGNKNDQHARKARDLYLLTHRTQMRLLRRTNDGYLRESVRSIRFELILLNNLGQVYGLTGQPDLRDRCLRDLLSTTVVVIDHNARVLDDGDGGDDGDHPQEHPGNNGDASRMDTNHDGDTDRGVPTTSNNNNNNSSSRPTSTTAGDGHAWRINLDGFLENTLHLVLRPSHTAGAA